PPAPTAEMAPGGQFALPAATIDGPAFAALDVLLVHADPLQLESMRQLLEARGGRVSVAGSAVAALTAYVTHGSPFALVVTDVLLAEHSGLELARRILDRDASANFLFLHMQSSFHGLVEEELLKRYPLLRWPLEPHAFLQAVQTALAKKS